MKKAERTIMSLNIDNWLKDILRKDSLERSMENGSNVSQSDIVNEILAAHYSVSKPAMDTENSKISKPDSKQESIPSTEQPEQSDQARMFNFDDIG